MITCPFCKSDDCNITGRPDEDNQVEYRCEDCGEYFFENAE